MIIRIVKMQFSPENVAAFITFFREKKEKIAHFPGCLHVELLQETDEGTTLFTHSHWQDEEALLAYRSSPFFKDTWQYAKSLFSERAAAWSLSPVTDRPL